MGIPEKIVPEALCFWLIRERMSGGKKENSTQNKGHRKNAKTTKNEHRKRAGKTE